MSGPLVNNFEVPSWAGKPAPGLHLDVTKDGKMVQKLMIDEKKCYFFGRNKQMCDFCIDHASCSRVHTALVWHKHLSRPFLIDLGSRRGLRPWGRGRRRKSREENEGNLLGLPESETELDNLTEFNTAHNRRNVAVTDIKDVTNPLKRKHKSVHITFDEDDEVINPEDVDPSIGRFRNMVQTHIIATKRPKIDTGLQQVSMTENITKRLQSFSYSQTLYENVPGVGAHLSAAGSFSMASKLGVLLPNLAPDVDSDIVVPINRTPAVSINVEETSKEPKKKKYAKEAWPGKKPAHSLLM